MTGIGNAQSLHNPRKRNDSKLAKKLAARGQLLREWRTLAGHSMVGLANELGVHHNTIANWEDGGTIPNWALGRIVEMGWPSSEARLPLNG
jgi:DNA-binding XRE family transcriptional regulator